MIFYFAGKFILGSFYKILQKRPIVKLWKTSTISKVPLLTFSSCT